MPFALAKTHVVTQAWVPHGAVTPLGHRLREESWPLPRWRLLGAQHHLPRPGLNSARPSRLPCVRTATSNGGVARIGGGHCLCSRLHRVQQSQRLPRWGKNTRPPHTEVGSLETMAPGGVAWCVVVRGTWKCVVGGAWWFLVVVLTVWWWYVVVRGAWCVLARSGGGALRGYAQWRVVVVVRGRCAWFVVVVACGAWWCVMRGDGAWWRGSAWFVVVRGGAWWCVVRGTLWCAVRGAWWCVVCGGSPWWWCAMRFAAGRKSATSWSVCIDWGLDMRTSGDPAGFQERGPGSSWEGQFMWWWVCVGINRSQFHESGNAQFWNFGDEVCAWFQATVAWRVIAQIVSVAERCRVRVSLWFCTTARTAGQKLGVASKWPCSSGSVLDGDWRRCWAQAVGASWRKTGRCECTLRRLWGTGSSAPCGSRQCFAEVTWRSMCLLLPWRSGCGAPLWRKSKTSTLLFVTWPLRDNPRCVRGHIRHCADHGAQVDPMQNRTVRARAERNSTRNKELQEDCVCRTVEEDVPFLHSGCCEMQSRSWVTEERFTRKEHGTRIRADNAHVEMFSDKRFEQQPRRVKLLTTGVLQ